MDIKEAAIWYNKQQSGLGKRFIQEVRLKVAKIKDNPLAYSIYYNLVHTAVLKSFPVMIHFIIDESNILITAILHISRSPKVWTSR